MAFDVQTWRQVAQTNSGMCDDESGFFGEGRGLIGWYWCEVDEADVMMQMVYYNMDEW